MKSVHKMLLSFTCMGILGAGFWATDVQAGCKLNVYVQNAGKYPVDVFNFKNNDETGVKSKMGFWRALINGNWRPATRGDLGVERFSVLPSKRKGDDYDAGFRCGANRRFRIKYMCMSGPNRGNHFTEYYPGQKSWTRRQTVTIPLRQCK